MSSDSEMQAAGIAVPAHTESWKVAGLLDAAQLAVNSLVDLKTGFAQGVDPARWVEQVSAPLIAAIAKATEACQPMTRERIREAAQILGGLGHAEMAEELIRHAEQSGKAEQLLLKMAPVVLNKAIADHVPFGLEPELRRWLAEAR